MLQKRPRRVQSNGRLFRLQVESLEEDPATETWDRDVLPHEMEAALASIRVEELEAIYLNIV